MKTLWSGRWRAAALLGGMLAAANAHAVLTLTADGIADGFSLSTFYTDPGVYYGVINLATASDGSILATGYARGQVYRFNDVDGQSFGSAVASASLPGAFAMAAAGGRVYATGGGTFYSISTGLAATPLTLTPGVSSSLGLWGNPVTGHLLSASNAGLIDIDPLAGTWRAIGPFGADGVSVSPDGHTAYAEIGGGVRGYDIATGTQVAMS